MMLIIILSIIILLLILIIVYLQYRLKSTINTLKNLKSIRGNDNIPKDETFEGKKLNIINKTAEILDTNFEKIPSKTSSLLYKLKRSQNKILKLSEENKKNKNKIAEFIAHTINTNPLKSDDLNLFIKKFDFFDDEYIMKKTCTFLTEKNNSIVVLFYIEKKIFVIVSCSDDLAKKGFDCRKIVKNLSNKVEGGFGGKKSFSMFKSNCSEIDFDFFSFCKSLIMDEAKKL